MLYLCAMFCIMRMKRGINILLVFSLLLALPMRAEAQPPKPVISCIYDALCEYNMFTTFLVDYTDDGTYGDILRFAFQYSDDETTWTTLCKTPEPAYTHYTKHLKEGSYRVVVGNSDCIDDLGLCTISDPIYLPVAAECKRVIPDPVDDVDDSFACTQGTLLFREDFGGNNQSDPMVGNTKYITSQLYNLQTSLNDPHDSGAAGHYWVTKTGWQHGNREGTSGYTDYCYLWTKWHIQDDHTYFNDFSRGYFLEVDGMGGNSVFYQTEIEVCDNLDLSFSAYVANVMPQVEYEDLLNRGFTVVHPQVRFAIFNAKTNELITDALSGEILPDKRWAGMRALAMCHSAQWHLVGTNFTVPQGVDKVKLVIYNNTKSGTGNDFALDDIEIFLCTPTVTVTSEHDICKGESFTLSAFVTDDSKFPEPFEYRWQHSSDSLNWETKVFKSLSRDSVIQSVQESDAGWWRLMVAGSGNIDHPNCRAVSKPFKLNVTNCKLKLDEFCNDGVLIFKEDFGGNDKSDPAVSADPVQGMSYTQKTDLQGPIQPSTYIVTKSGFCRGDTLGWQSAQTDEEKRLYASSWFIQDDHTSPDDKSTGYFLEVEGAKDQERLYQSDEISVCEGQSVSCSAFVVNVMTPAQYDLLNFLPNQNPYDPTLRFVIRNADTDAELESFVTAPITPDETLTGLQDWRFSAAWKQVGATYIVAAGVSSIILEIYNENTESGQGNDFAIDDIEVRLCLPEVQITNPVQDACEDSPFRFEVTLSDPSLMPEDVAYQWYFSPDNTTWEQIAGADSLPLTFDNLDMTQHPGWYKVVLGSTGLMDHLECCAVSEPYELKVIDCTPPELPEFGLISKTTACEGSSYCFELDTLNKSSFTPLDYSYAWDYSQDSITWVQRASDIKLCLSSVALEDAGWYRLRLAYEQWPYDVHDTTCFKLSTRDCTQRPLPKIIITSDHEVCQDSAYCFEVEITNADELPDSYVYAYEWEFSRNGRIYAHLSDGLDLCFPAVAEPDSGWYRLTARCVSPAFDETSTTRNFLLDVVDCSPPELPQFSLISKDTVCKDSPYCFELDTLNKTSFTHLDYSYAWDYSKDSITWTQRASTIELCLPSVAMEDAGWYRLRVSYEQQSYDIHDTTCFHLRTKDCTLIALPELIIASGNVVCRDSAYCFEVEITNADDLPAAYVYAYEWEFSPNGQSYAHLSDGLDLCFPAVAEPDSGWYRLTARCVSPAFEETFTTQDFLLDVKDCTPPEEPEEPEEVDFDLCLTGKLLFKEDFGGNSPEDPEVSCETHPNILYTNGCKTTGKMPESYYRLTKKDQGYYNHQWEDRVDHTYPKDASRGYFLMIEGGNSHQFYSATVPGGAKDDRLSFSAYVVNLHDNIHEGEYKMPDILVQFVNPATQEVIADYTPSDVSLKSHSEMSRWHIMGTNFTLPADLATVEVKMFTFIHGHEGNDFGIDDIEVRLCRKVPTERKNYSVCDTLLPVVWYGIEWFEGGTKMDTLTYSDGTDSVYLHLYLEVLHGCCPEIQTFQMDTVVCDTLLPFRWQLGDTVLLFSKPEQQEVAIPHPKWKDCTGATYTLRLDTIHCDRLYPLIVNKYNWVLVCNNTMLAELFPERHAVAYAWYKNGELIENATADDYSENAELSGSFQLHVTLDDERLVMSNVLNIEPATPDGQRVTCYNHLGMLLFETDDEPDLSGLPSGMYIIVYQSANSSHIEKLLIP